MKNVHLISLDSFLEISFARQKIIFLIIYLFNANFRLLFRRLSLGPISIRLRRCFSPDDGENSCCWFWQSSRAGFNCFAPFRFDGSRWLSFHFTTAFMAPRCIRWKMLIDRPTWSHHRVHKVTSLHIQSIVASRLQFENFIEALKSIKSRLKI